MVGSSEPILSGVSVVVEEAGTEPAALAELLAPPVALGAGQAMPGGLRGCRSRTGLTTAWTNRHKP